MIILNSVNRKLEIDLAGSVSSVEGRVTVFFKDIRAEDAKEGYGTQITLTTGATEVTICDAPRSGVTRIITGIHIFNADSASITLTIQIDDGGTNYTIFQATLATLESATYESGTGWQVYTVAGAIK